MAQEKHEYVAKGRRVGKMSETMTVTFHASSDDEARELVRDKLRLRQFKLYREIHRDSQLQPVS